MFRRPRKYALIIGNAGYGGRFALSNPKADAAALAEVLSTLKFDVTLKTDLTYAAMTEVVDEFVATLEVNPVDVGLFYFSGHGVQLNEQNFLVPTDYDSLDSENIVQLVRVQDLLDRIAENSQIKILLLDACRSSSPTPDSLNSKSVYFRDINKTMYVNKQSVPVPGLAEIKAETNTFIAFAAAPGGVAFDGTKNLSPFTEALVKYIDAVDLPLSNLTSRIRQEVLLASGGRQRTWDQSSLISPFFFNPGSLLLFTGNMMALTSVVISLIPYSLLLESHDNLPRLLVAALLPLISLSILVSGMQAVYSRMRGRFRHGLGPSAGLNDHILVSLRKGAIGGYIGSLVAGVCISIPYHWGWTQYSILEGAGPPDSLGAVMLEITIATAISACVLGFLSLFCSRANLSWSGITLSKTLSDRRILIGSGFGGVLAGSLMAPILMVYFGSLSRPDMTPILLLPGAILGASFVIFTIINFDFERLSIKRLLSGLAGSLIALVCGVILAVLLFGVLYYVGTVGFVINWLETDANSVSLLILGGIVYGSPVGFVLGFILGAAAIFTQRLSGKPVIST